MFYVTTVDVDPTPLIGDSCPPAFCSSKPSTASFFSFLSLPLTHLKVPPRGTNAQQQQQLRIERLHIFFVTGTNIPRFSTATAPCSSDRPLPPLSLRATDIRSLTPV